MAARPSKTVPPQPGISLLTTARFSVTSFMLHRVSYDRLEVILSQKDDMNDRVKLRILDKYSTMCNSSGKDMLSLITRYRKKSGGFMATTHSQAKLHAIEQKMGLDSYIKARYLFIGEITDEYGFSLLALSIDNNIPVILQDGGSIYLCLAYDDSSIIVADMARVTGRITSPGFVDRMDSLKQLQKQGKDLSDSDKAWLAKAENCLKAGDYPKFYEDFYFCPVKTDDILSIPFLFRLPRDSFQKAHIRSFSAVPTGETMHSRRPSSSKRR